ncbi:RusA family crossover junction endodeoxyribonuclease [Delftia tsuruhatensis]|uniref:RusA family crossover junction endodeoxyribonuclease n=1 Tax=Delftia tsuruhatensis TaxID=180282 RepID=UPI0039BD85FC
MTQPVTIVLPYPVSANRYWQTRVIRKGATHMALTYVSAEAKAFKEKVGWLARAAGVQAPIKGRFNLAITLHPHRPKDADRRIRRDPHEWEDTVQCIDLDNASKVSIDALKGIVFEDDGWAWEIVSRRGEPVEGGKLVVTITPRVVANAPVPEQGDLLGALA